MRPVMKEHKNHICVIVMMAYTAIPFRGVLHSIPACHQDQLHCALVPATLDRVCEMVQTKLLSSTVHEDEKGKQNLLVAMPFATSSFLLLVVRPGAPSSVLAPSSDALCSYWTTISALSRSSPRKGRVWFWSASTFSSGSSLGLLMGDVLTSKRLI